MKQDSRVNKQCKEILEKVAKYNILYKYQYSSAVKLQRSMTISILTDLNRRHFTYRTDLLPIVANLCAYDVRFATKEEGFKRQSLSMSILALYIANGELLGNFCRADMLKHNVFDFLKENSVQICAPLPDGELTLIKHCRLSVLDLSPVGVHTQGVLWRLGDVIAPRCIPRSSCATTSISYQRDLFRNGLNDYQRDRLADLLSALNEWPRFSKRRYQCVINDLKNYLYSTKSSPKYDDWPSKHSMNAMASGVVDAMDTRKYLQFARPVGRSPGSGRGIPYRAIFVRDRGDLQNVGSTSAYIFTSWSRTNKHNKDEMQCRKIARYVSLEVGVDEEVSNETVKLRSKKWVNGLCFFEGEKKFPFVFEWPDLLSQ
ncbi:hypothetical protein GQ44DRAFT_832700 [Phaeosphaeriaceae sp. PMI808]|nr:hypothetical protein GQ44DRAFT_832700 [Phaeosphaeriaceae sp. PMI808]